MPILSASNSEMGALGARPSRASWTPLEEPLSHAHKRHKTNAAKHHTPGFSLYQQPPLSWISILTVQECIVWLLCGRICGYVVGRRLETICNRFNGRLDTIHHTSVAGSAMSADWSQVLEEETCRTCGDNGTEIPGDSWSVNVSIVSSNFNVHIVYKVYNG